MRAKQVHLQFANLIGGNADIAELPNPSRNCVSNAVLTHEIVDHLPRCQNLFARIGSEQNRTAVVDHAAQICEREMFAVDVKSGHSRLLATSFWLLACFRDAFKLAVSNIPVSERMQPLAAS